LNHLINEHKSVIIYNNGLVVDSILLIHELSHLSNQPDKKRNQVNNLLTEAIAFAYEFIYLDYLYKEGYKEDSLVFRYSLMETFNVVLNKAYPLLRVYYTYDKTGSLSKENYKFIFKNSDDYEEVLKEFYEIISHEQDEIFSVLWYVVALYLSIYMYINYKRDDKFIENINLLNDNLNKLDLEGLLKIINLECKDNDFFTDNNNEKIEMAFFGYIFEFNCLKDMHKKKNK